MSALASGSIFSTTGSRPDSATRERRAIGASAAGTSAMYDLRRQIATHDSRACGRTSRGQGCGRSQ